jgi:hypothetical protein
MNLFIAGGATRRRYATVLCTLAVFAATLLPVRPLRAATIEEPLTVSFDGTFHIAGITRGGDVLVMGISRVQVQYGHGHTTVERRIVTDSGRVSEVSYVPRSTPLPTALWIFVDQSTGRHLLTTTGGPSGVMPLQASVSDGLVTNDGDLFAVRLAVADVVVVSPSEGSWETTIFDGGKTDDRVLPDGFAKCKADKLKPHKGDKKKDKFKKDDLVIIIEPRTLAALAVRVK